MAWLFLVIAGIFEVVWAVLLKYSNGFTRLVPSILTIAGMIISFFFLSLSLKSLPIGNAYAIWTGIGAIGTVILGILLFDDPATPARLALIGLILVGIIGLKLTS
jgi:quaternary ammonium compound-resistance protein SugE